jgi:pimeloyl-ACP methyl ester carboxylesterase
VVVVHGFKGFKDWAFFPYLARELATAGFAVVSFNFSRNGIGEDPEAFTELEAFAQNTLTRELDELRWVLEATASEDLLPRRPDAVALVGHSRGGAQSVLAASEEPRVRALVTWAAVANLDRWTEETRREWRAAGRVYVLNGRTGQQMPLDVTLLEDYEANAGRLDVTVRAGVVSAPWLIVHGEDDLTVSPADAQILVGEGQNARLHRVPGAGHTFEVGHPFKGPSPQLEDATTATVRHLLARLGGD